jgi:hypothetical protein
MDLSATLLVFILQMSVRGEKTRALMLRATERRVRSGAGSRDYRGLLVEHDRGNETFHSLIGKQISLKNAVFWDVTQRDLVAS